MRHPASFRDPSGFIFLRDGVVYRQVTPSGAADYQQFKESGLYEALRSTNLVLPFEESAEPPADPVQAHCVIRPDPVPFISYPYEWGFAQLKDAALATLAIQRIALDHGMILKDASAYNIQFVDGRPVLIDHLSFEAYDEGMQWVGYRQFCQHFLAPLALMAHTSHDLGRLLQVHIDGIPLSLARALLPGKTRLSFGLLSHIHLHARAQDRYADTPNTGAVQRSMSPSQMTGLVHNLEQTVKKLNWTIADKGWGDYYDNTNYSDTAFKQKESIIGAWLDDLTPKRVLDLGANNGAFSRLSSARGAFTISCDMDPVAVHSNYLKMKKDGEKRMHPLWVDLAQPSPSLGWAQTERESFSVRVQSDVLLALALVHHLAIGHNIPLDQIASWFRSLGTHLIIEFVPRSDSQVKRLLASRKDIFDGYTKVGFEDAFGQYYHIRDTQPVPESERILYLMEGKE